jgi:hypothetical protein
MNKRTVTILENGKERRITLRELEKITGTKPAQAPYVFLGRNRQIRTRGHG